MPTLTVIIPVFNKWSLTRDCLNSLAKNTPLDNLTRVIVADNGSSDETATDCPLLGHELFGDRFFHLRFEKNLNFGPACNAAARMADTDLLFFLNNDTLMTPDWLPPLTNALESDPTLVGVGPLLSYPDGTVQHLGVAFWPAGACLGHYLRSISAAHPLARKKRTFQAITAAALLLPRAHFLEAGKFCEEFINGFEDVDLCLRMTKEGKRMAVIPESQVCHLESQTPTRHEGEAHNSLLLRERYDLAARDDLELLARADGYVLRVSPDFTVTLTVTPERNQELLRRLNAERRLAPVRCGELLTEEPYWEDGYFLFGEMYEKQGQWKNAVHIYSQAFLLIPSLDLITRMLRAATRAGIVLDNLRQAYQTSVQFILNRRAYNVQFSRYRVILQNHGHENLLPAYEEAARQATEFRAARRAAGGRG